MNGKRIISILAILVFLILMVSGISCGSKSSPSSQVSSSSKDKQLYTCGMHPNVIQEGPGVCPICNMNLVPLESAGKSSGGGSGEILYWVSSMDPTFVRDAPGKDSMGMDLVPVYADELMGGSGITIDPSVIQSIGVRYAQVVTGPVEKVIRATAHVDYNEDEYSALSTRADGWIEKLYVSSPGAAVKKGDPLFEFYSPKIYSAQEEYIIAKRMGDSSLIKASRERLKLLGIEETMIDRIGSGDHKRTLTIVAPRDGVVINLGSSSSGGGRSSGNTGSGSSGGMSGMGGSSGASGGMNDSQAGMSVSQGSTIREGDYVASGTQVFTIADLSTVWVYAHVYEDEPQYIYPGMDVTLELAYLPGEVMNGTVSFMYPYLDRTTRDIKIRMVFENENRKLLPGMLGTVTFRSRIMDNGILIPKEAVVYSGNKRVVFLALPGGRFAPKEVELGVTSGDDMVSVVSGLYAGQTIVTSAQFLIDSESRFREALNKMLSGESTELPPASHQHGNEMSQAPPMKPDEKPVTEKTPPKPDESISHAEKKVDEPVVSKPEEKKEATEEKQESSGSGESWPNLAPDDPNAKYGCPMPEDRYYSSEPGECPVCGMFLTEHDPEKWKHDHEGAGH